MSPRWTRRINGLLIALLVAGPLSAPASAAAIRINKKPPAVKYTEFDPTNKPRNMPHLDPGDSAVCLSEFGTGVQLAFVKPTGRKQPNGKFRAYIIVDEIRVDLNLSIDLWLPTDASKKLKAHEEGHRQISEKMYAEVADKAIRAAADKINGKRFEGEGDTARDAEKAATDALTAAHSAMIKAYLAETSTAGKKIQDAYDELTEHGGKYDLLEPEAIRRAWAAHPPPMWTPPKPPATKPATAPVKPTTPAPKPAATASPATRPVR